MDKNLDFFLKSNAKENMVEVEIEGISKFCYPDSYENKQLVGKPVPWLLLPITVEEVEKIRKKHTTRIKGKKGRQPEEIVDQVRAGKELMVECIVYPDFRSEQMRNSYGLEDPISILEEVLNLLGDFTRMQEEVNNILGLGDDGNDLVDAAKN